ncbi:acetyl esterase/lipase [Sphingomonas aurantiaca]|jgi:acetyl esterase/lipase|uniref:Acetyl esterase/lipase n=1 Tax=Sphingomonas aurantiaca TaxID=185949 RepID=A0A2T5GTW9_9SPHN|nr:alpha/beta hydrolase [Sphingomonas aurantiaca]PTQ62761.1 acetyl esterase/lipase [Sphingomonas aurantiaca]
MRLFLAAALLLPLAVMPTPAAADLLTWSVLTARPKPVADATIAYGPDQMQKVDVWLPKGKGPFPVVVMVHGGCWTTSIADRSLMNWVADDLRRSGVAVWNIDYRGVDRAGGGYPGTFADAAQATDALAKQARRFKLDTARVTAIGHSAGGHLALWLAARPKQPATSPLYSAHPLRIDHAISLGGLPDLEATAASPENGCGVEVVAKLVGAPGARHPDVYADTSVPRLLPLGVRQDLINGREDRIIPFAMATDYVAKAVAAGDTATLHVIPATGHVELIAPETAAWAAAKRLILADIGKTQ